jgi:hypothetical protein
MVANKVNCTLTITTLVATLYMDKTFFSRHLFNEVGKVPWSSFKGKKLN